jgi:hypothetical protein
VGDEPRDALALLGEAVWSGSWRQAERPDTLLTRLQRKFALLLHGRRNDGRTDSRGEIDRLIAVLPNNVIEPVYSGSGEIVSPSLSDQRSYEDSISQSFGRDLNWAAVNKDAQFGRRGFLLRASGAGVNYRHREKLAQAVAKNTKWHRIAAPNIAQNSDGAFRETGWTFTHWRNRDIEF